ncbi:hypothetical protein DI487_13080 [Flavobacterium sediminis]|uniref:Uncharacterized protein n=1 Tax=Flavobacterium sediminis TaxID=2201181 RepID=A0A2U8QXB1_9FLAO|nr:hypothetical protein DI487_13080 [Flavobacterium sediminis]
MLLFSISVIPVLILFFDGYAKGRLKLGFLYIIYFLLFLTFTGFMLHFFTIYSIFIFPLSLFFLIAFKIMKKKKTETNHSVF